MKNWLEMSRAGKRHNDDVITVEQVLQGNSPASKLRRLSGKGDSLLTCKPAPTGSSSMSVVKDKSSQRNTSIIGTIMSVFGFGTSEAAQSHEDDETDAESNPPSEDSSDMMSSVKSSRFPRSPSSHSIEELRVQILKHWRRNSSSNQSISTSAIGNSIIDNSLAKNTSSPYGNRGRKKRPPPPVRPPDLISVFSAADAALLPPSVYPGSEQRLLWYCETCSTFHALTSTHAMTPFTKKHGLSMRDVGHDGDCFYSCVIECLKTDVSLSNEEESYLTVQKLRDLVARRMTQEQLEFYRMEAQASPKAAHLDFVRPISSGQEPNPSFRSAPALVVKNKKGGIVTSRTTATARNSARLATVEHSIGGTGPEVDTLDELKEYVRREGRSRGMGNCLWADSFAQMVVAESFRLTILLVDMERDKGCFPFRFMHRFCMDTEFDSQIATGCSTSSSKSATRGSKGPPVIAAASIVGNKSERFIILKRQGPVGHFQYMERTEDGRAVFTYKELPTVIRTLWAL